VVCRNFTVGSGTEGLCVIFRSVICLSRLDNSLPVFGRVSYEISHILSATLKIVYDYNVYKSSFNQIRLSAVHINSFIYINRVMTFENKSMTRLILYRRERQGQKG
jgi:hypothetical protein